MPRWLIVELPDGFPGPEARPADFEAATLDVSRAVGSACGLAIADPLRISYRRAPDPVAELLDAEGVHPS